MFLNKLSIKTRLIFLVAFLCTQLVIGAIVGIVSLGGANDRMESMYADRLTCLSQLDQVIRLLNRNQLAIARAVTEDSAAMAREVAEVERNREQANGIWKEYLGTNLTEDEKVLATAFSDARQEFLAKALDPAVAAIRAGDKDKAAKLVDGPMIELFGPVRQHMNELIKLQTDEAAKEFHQAQSAYTTIRNIYFAALLIGLAWSVLVSAWIIRSISNPLEEAIRVAGCVAAGDLTQKISVTSQDEMGRLLEALSHMNDGLANIVTQVRESTETIGSASSQIATGNVDLSSRTEQQASSLEETASSMEELTSTVRHTEENARLANMLARTASDVASKGGTVVSQVISTMGDINESAKRIVDIISVIDGIAFQTNILALNAAVEAARAGEQGRGFAVVAAEVRGLAQRSASAAKEIKILIGNSVEKVAAGSRLVGEAGTTMDEVVVSIKRVTDIVGEISAATREQAAGIDQINQAITQMDDVTQQNAALVEEAAAAASSMQDQAMQLTQVVSVFKLHGQFVSLTGVPSTPLAPVISRQSETVGRIASRKRVAIRA